MHGAGGQVSGGLNVRVRAGLRKRVTPGPSTHMGHWIDGDAPRPVEASQRRRAEYGTREVGPGDGVSHGGVGDAVERVDAHAEGQSACDGIAQATCDTCDKEGARSLTQLARMKPSQ